MQSPSWAANWFAASQEIPRISRNPKVHYRTHNRPPPVSILGQPNSVHIPTSHLLEIRPNIIHPSTPRSPQWFPHQDPIHPPLHTHTRHMPSPYHSSWFVLVTKILVCSDRETECRDRDNSGCPEITHNFAPERFSKHAKGNLKIYILWTRSLMYSIEERWSAFWALGSRT